MEKIKKQIKKGLIDSSHDDPFEVFVSSTNVRFSYYKESHKILGNTFGMCVLQDFEALTPNLLARTIETVEGGGLVVILLKSVTSLKQLYTMTMVRVYHKFASIKFMKCEKKKDVHARFRKEDQEIVSRFNERFILSLGSCSRCMVVDDTLNVLPISSHVRGIESVPKDLPQSEFEQELGELKDSLKESEVIGTVLQNARTLDQAKALLVFLEAISEKTLRSTVALTAARGRGKSATMGMAIASAVAMGYSNIFVTSPSPENLKTLFEFLFKTFDSLGFKEHVDYELVESTNPKFSKCVVRVNVFHSHRQTIQYIQPTDFQRIGQAELVVVDEAAAIPLAHVRRLFGPHLLFLSSTVNGYEGTGRSLSLKLIKQLRDQQDVTAGPSSTGRVLRELTLDEPIRYRRGDPVESWLHQLLCLDATIVNTKPVGCPHPSACNL